MRARAGKGKGKRKGRGKGQGKGQGKGHGKERERERADRAGDFISKPPGPESKIANYTVLYRKEGYSM